VAQVAADRLDDQEAVGRVDEHPAVQVPRSFQLPAALLLEPRSRLRPPGWRVHDHLLELLGLEWHPGCRTDGESRPAPRTDSPSVLQEWGTFPARGSAPRWESPLDGVPRGGSIAAGGRIRPRAQGQEKAVMVIRTRKVDGRSRVVLPEDFAYATVVI